MPAQLRIPQPAADQLSQRVVLALTMPAQIPLRVATVGVAHAGGGELRQPRIQHGPQFGRGGELAHTHPVHPLTAAPDEPALAGPILLGELPVRIELGGQPMSDLLQLIGPQILGMLGQRPLSLLHLNRRHMIGQVTDELLDHPQMLDVEQPGLPRLGRGRQQRRQLLTGQRGPRCQLLGVAQPAFGLPAADPQHVGQHDVHRRAALVLLEVAELIAGDRDLPAQRGLQPVDGDETLGRGQLP